MSLKSICVIALLLGFLRVVESENETNVKFKIEARKKLCIYERGRKGQMMETQYQVIDGQHGELDISFYITNPTGGKMLNDHKKSENSIIFDLDMDGDYAFCMDNTYSLMNSKIVYVYVLIEDKDGKVAAVTEKDSKEEPEEVLEWMGIDANGTEYYLEVADIAESLTRTLDHVARARRMLYRLGVFRSRDSHLAFEDTFIVDVWSTLQITLMIVAGFVQVYMIKKLFNRCEGNMDQFY